MKGSLKPLPPPPATLEEPAARAAAIAQLSHLPWGHPNALELRRLFRLLGVR